MWLLLWQIVKSVYDSDDMIGLRRGNIFRFTENTYEDFVWWDEKAGQFQYASVVSKTPAPISTPKISVVKSLHWLSHIPT